MKHWCFLTLFSLFLGACASSSSIGVGATASFNNYDYRTAAKKYAELIAHNPTNEQVYNLSMAYLSLGEVQRARPFLLYLHEQDKANTAVMEALLYAEFTLGEWEQVRLVSEQLLAVDPHRVAAWYYQAQLLSQKAQHQDAIELLLAVYQKRAVAQVAVALAHNYDALGNKAEAKVWTRLGGSGGDSVVAL